MPSTRMAADEVWKYTAFNQGHKALVAPPRRVGIDE